MKTNSRIRRIRFHGPWHYTPYTCGFTLLVTGWDHTQGRVAVIGEQTIERATVQPWRARFRVVN